MNPELLYVRTPATSLSGSNHSIVIKDETRQTSGAFKYRGAIHRLRFVPAGTDLYAASTGNHGLAVALAAKAMHLRAFVYVPNDADQHKISLIKASGATVVIGGETLAESAESAKAGANNPHSLWLSGFDDLEIVRGYNSIFTEFFEDYPDLSEVFVPVGGGGLLAAALQAVPPQVEVCAVHSEGCQSLAASIASRSPISCQLGLTIAGGLRVPKIGKLALQSCLSRPPRLVAVSDAEILQAMKLLWVELGIKAEPSGAASLAGALRFPGKRKVGCIVSGGNFATENHRSLVGF